MAQVEHMVLTELSLAKTQSLELQKNKIKKCQFQALHRLLATHPWPLATGLWVTLTYTMV